MASNDGFLEALQQALGTQAPGKAYPTKIATRRSRRSTQFSERIKANAEVADELIAITKALNKKGSVEEVEKLIDIIKKHLDNNAKLQEVVGEALLDIPN